MAAPPQPHADESLADIGRQIADDAARLVRAEIELAKLGAIESLKRVAIAVGLVLVALPMLIIGATLAFASLPQHFGDTWWAWALAGAGFLLLAMLLAVIAITRITAAVRQQKQTVADLKEDVEWVRQLTKRDSSAS